VLAGYGFRRPNALNAAATRDRRHTRNSALLRVLWRYRHFILSSIRAEQKSRFARSKLGAIWAVLHPLAQSLVFALILSEVLAARLPRIDNKAAYAIYVMAGMAAWGLFAEIVNRSLTMFLDHAGSLKKVSFPRSCMPLIVFGNALFNHLILLAVAMAVFIAFGHYPTWTWLALPLGMALITVFAFGVGITLGILNVFSRDVAQVFSVILQIWFWLTPIVYTRETPPEYFRWYLDVNPLTPLVSFYQQVMLYGEWPTLDTLAVPAVIGSALFVGAFALFRRAGPEMVDAL
jgi:lipopolysaccharide transport system permease protein